MSVEAVCRVKACEPQACSVSSPAGSAVGKVQPGDRRTAAEIRFSPAALGPLTETCDVTSTEIRLHYTVQHGNSNKKKQ